MQKESWENDTGIGEGDLTPARNWVFKTPKKVKASGYSG
jgi:hypothetical protein